MNLSVLLKNLEIISTGNVCDSGKEAVLQMDAAIKPLAYSMKVAGPAFTVEVTDGDNLSIHHAILLAPPSSVLVINAKGRMNAGYIGDMVSRAAHLQGIKGAVIDGTCRDIDDIIQMNFPLFARGVNPHYVKKLTKGKINVTTQCGGVQVSPGDIIFGDASGVVVIPQNEAERILLGAENVAIKELEFVKQLHEGKTTVDLFNLEKWHG